MDSNAVIEQQEDYTMSKWLQETLAWMKTLPRHEPESAALDGYEGPPATEVRYHHVQHGEPAQPPEPTPTPATSTPRGEIPIDEVKRMVAAKRRQMAAEREGREVRRRIRNEFARDLRYVLEDPPDGYAAALARQRGAEPEELDIYEDGPVPDGYSLALKKLGLPEPLPMVRDDDGIPLPYETALQCR